MRETTSAASVLTDDHEREAAFLSHLHKFLFQRRLLPVIDVHGPAVVVLKRSADRHVVKAVQVQVRHGRDGGAEAGAARLVFVPAAVRVGGAAGLVDRL